MRDKKHVKTIYNSNKSGLHAVGAALAAIAFACTARASETLIDHSKMHMPTANVQSGDYYPQPVTYTPTVWPYVAPVLGDGSNSRGGIPPVKPVPIIASNFDTDKWSRISYPAQSAGVEAKFRSHCNFSHVANDDPIVFPGKPGVSHTHMYFGNTLANANSTYASLRTTGESTCGGGPLNRSAYWFPAVMKENALGTGKTMVLKMDFAMIYYGVDGSAQSGRATRIYRGLNYVFGFNPADPTDKRQQDEIAMANKSGPYASYRYRSNGFGGWKCEVTNGSYAKSPIPLSPTQPYLRNADGSPTLLCPTSERIAAVVQSPQCWDGHNLTSPDGRSHVRQFIRENNTGRFNICPQGWYELPYLNVSVWFSHNGPDDYKEWFLASDRMNPDAPFLNGQSFHMDWFGAWDNTVMRTWMVNCIGISIGRQKGNPHSCIDTQFGDGTAGLVLDRAPDGSRSPQVNLKTRWATMDTGRFLPLP